MSDDVEPVVPEVLPDDSPENILRTKEVESTKRPVSRNDSRVSQLGDYVKVIGLPLGDT